MNNPNTKSGVALQEEVTNSNLIENPNPSKFKNQDPRGENVSDNQPRGVLKPFSLTYTKGTWSKKGRAIESSHCQETYSNSGMETNITDLNVPVALRKGTRSCTHHPVSNFVEYEHLSKSLQALVVNLEKYEVPRDIQVVKHDKWRKAVLGGNSCT